MISDLPEQQCSLKLFLSVDIIGSTPFKADPKFSHTRGDLEGYSWPQFFAGFYESFPRFLVRLSEETWQRFADETPVEKVEVKTWKSLGDELLLEAHLTDHRQSGLLICAFKEAMRQYQRREIDAKELPLGLKGTAWIAGFPVVNTELMADDNPVDYIGPSIDCGFRLCKHATKRKLIVSIDLVLLLTACNDFPLYFKYDGKKELKGVLGGRLYPIIWVDMRDGDPTLEDQLIANPPPVSKELLSSFVLEYIQEVGRPLIRPFIEGDTEFNKKPEWYDEEFERAIRLTEEPEAEGADNVQDTSQEAQLPDTYLNMIEEIRKEQPPEDLQPDA